MAGLHEGHRRIWGVATQWRWVALFVACGNAASPRAGVAQLSARQTRVEVVAPESPQPVTANGRQVLVYELHVTNFGRGPLAFREVDVLDSAAPAVPIAVYRDTALRGLLQRIGHGDTTNLNRLDAGARTVVYLWLSFPLHQRLPTTLRHRLRFDILDSADVTRDRGTQSAIDSIFVRVGHAIARVLRPPLDSGIWVAGSGPSNTSDHRRALNAVDGHAYIAQRFAIDWVKVGPNGNTYQGDEHRNESFWDFGQPVYAVATGEVVGITDSIADNTPHEPPPYVTLANISGNTVTLRIGPHQYAQYAHLKHGSIRVRLHQRVMPGDVIAQLGNSGQTTGPHLHFQVADGPSFLASEGVPYTLTSFHDLGPGQDFELNKHPDALRHDEIPVEDAVVSFP